MDQQLYTKDHNSPVLWRPEQGSSVMRDFGDYRSFSCVVRTVHIYEALDMCRSHRMIPKHIFSLSCLKRKILRPNHPCYNLQVLWFGTKQDSADEDAHDWYGNVEFAVSSNLMLQNWKNYYLVDMLTARTHTATRILVTNSDYSKVLPKYDPFQPGGAWHVTDDGRHHVLADCRRYNNKGYNRHGHTLEFMIEVTPFGMQKILEGSEISFRNHDHMKSRSVHHVCHRYREAELCPSPYSRACGSMCFFREHERQNATCHMSTPKLSRSAEKFRRCFLKMQPVPRNIISCVPSLSDHDFPPLHHTFPPPPPVPSQEIFTQRINLNFGNGKVLSQHLLAAKNLNNCEFLLFVEKLLNLKEEVEEEDTQPGTKPGPNPGLLPLPYPPPRPPFLLPTPAVMPNQFGHPAWFQHSWAPMQPLTYPFRLK